MNITKQNPIGYHKIETQVQGQSRRSGGRILAFFIMHDEDDNAYIIPTFFFATQEENKYTTNFLTSPQFGKKLLQKLDNFMPNEMREIKIWEPKGNY